MGEIGLEVHGNSVDFATFMWMWIIKNEFIQNLLIIDYHIWILALKYFWNFTFKWSHFIILLKKIKHLDVDSSKLSNGWGSKVEI
jgi:hypothetical protein